MLGVLVGASTYAHWAVPNEPNGGINENCVEMYGLAHNPAMSGWNDIPCSGGSSVSCHCQKPAASVVSTPACPNGWTGNGDKCYLMDLTRPSGSWSDCGNYCAANSASMLCIQDSTQENYILDHMGALPSVWLSYNDIAVEGNWRWAAGCQNNGYTHWDSLYHEPNGGYTENCAELYARNAEGRGWNDAKCDGLDVNWPKYCFCQAGVTYAGGGGVIVSETAVPAAEPTLYPTSVAPPIDTGTLCAQGWLEYNGICYLLEDTVGFETAAACSDHCTSLGANMLCIEDANTERFVLQNDYTDDYNGYHSRYGVWLDYSCKNSAGAFTWGAGCVNMDYVNWSPGEPQGATEGCTLLSFESETWLNSSCALLHPMSCYCSTSSTRATPTDDTATDAPAASGSDGASSGNSSVGWIIAAVVAGVAVLGGGVALLAWCYTNARAAPSGVPSVYAAVPPPSPYVPVQQQPAYSGNNSTAQYPSYNANYYSGGSIAMVPVPVQPPAAGFGTAPVSRVGAVGAKYSSVVPSAPSEPSAPPMQVVVATATAVPYEYTGGGYDNTQIVMAEVVMDSSNV